MPNIISYGQFSNLVANMFTRPEDVKSTLGTTITAEALAIANVFVFGSGINAGDTLTAAEITAISDFVADGGTLIVVGEVSFFPAVNGEANSLLAGVGAAARIVSANVSGFAEYNTGAFNTANSVSGMFELSAGSIVAANGAEVLASLSGSAVLTHENVGGNEGQVFVLSDNANPGATLGKAITAPDDTIIINDGDVVQSVYNGGAGNDTLVLQIEAIDLRDVTLNSIENVMFNDPNGTFVTVENVQRALEINWVNDGFNGAEFRDVVRIIDMKSAGTGAERLNALHEVLVDGPDFVVAGPQTGGRKVYELIEDFGGEIGNTVMYTRDKNLVDRFYDFEDGKLASAVFQDNSDSFNFATKEIIYDDAGLRSRVTTTMDNGDVQVVDFVNGVRVEPTTFDDGALI